MERALPPHPSLQPEVFGSQPLSSTCTVKRGTRTNCSSGFFYISLEYINQPFGEGNTEMKARAVEFFFPPLFTRVSPPTPPHPFSNISQKALPLISRQGRHFIIIVLFNPLCLCFIFRGNFVSICLKPEPNKITRIICFLLKGS